MSLARDVFRDRLLKMEQALVDVESRLRTIRRGLADMEEYLASEEADARKPG